MAVTYWKLAEFNVVKTTLIVNSNKQVLTIT